MIKMSKEEWIKASYLIEAKKDIDSLLYLNEQFDNIPKIGIKEFYDSKRADFYLKLVILIDNCFSTQQKSSLKKQNECIRTVLDYRNKYFAHKDVHYVIPDHNSRKSITDEMIEHIQCVKKCCSKMIPKEITLNFVPHDRLLFRLIHGIDKQKEEEIERKKYLPVEKGDDGILPTFKAFNHVEDIKKIPPSEYSDYGVVVENGISCYEGLQNRQDFCIKCNILFETKMWVQLDNKSVDIQKQLQKFGVLDDYGIFHSDKLDDETILKVAKLMEGVRQ